MQLGIWHEVGGGGGGGEGGGGGGASFSLDDLNRSWRTVRINCSVDDIETRKNKWI